MIIKIEWIDILYWGLWGVQIILCGMLLSKLPRLLSNEKWLPAKGTVTGRLRGVIRDFNRRVWRTPYRYYVPKRASIDEEGFILLINYEVGDLAYQYKTRQLVAGYEEGDEIAVWYKETEPSDHHLFRDPREIAKKEAVLYTCLTVACVLVIGALRFFFIT